MSEPPPAAKLAGRTVDDWHVIRGPTGPDDPQTVGAFSHYYEARKDGRTAFLKAIDLTRMLQQPEGKTLTARALNAQESEAALLEHCQTRRLTRVIDHFGGGVWIDPDNPTAATPVPYVVTERADGGDLRSKLVEKQSIDLAVVLAAVHDLAAGVQQVHAARIAHLDLKPSNALRVSDRTKIGDFGHAVAEDSPYPAVQGTLAYAPPETLYGAMPTTLSGLRAIDLYLLGSLVAGIFTRGLPLTALTLRMLDPALHPDRFTGPYHDVLPSLMDAYQDALEVIHVELMPDGEIGDRLGHLVAQLCWPDPDSRGIIDEQRGHHDRLSLRRVVAELNFLAQRVAYESRAG